MGVEGEYTIGGRIGGGSRWEGGGGRGSRWERGGKGVQFKFIVQKYLSIYQSLSVYTVYYKQE